MIPNTREPVIYSPEQSAAILRAAQDIELSNNGWSIIPACPIVQSGLQAAGYVVIAALDYHGRPVYKGYTKKAQAALQGQEYGQSTYRPSSRIASVDVPDYEGAILARQERETMDY